MQRGAIRNEKYARILRDFTGLQFERGITPTDIDGYVEFGNKVFIFIEAKYKTTVLSTGQRLALARLVDAVGETHESLLIVASHDVEPEEDRPVDYANCVVAEFRHNKTWIKPSEIYVVRELIDFFREARQ
jgi:hypothetical protein